MKNYFTPKEVRAVVGLSYRQIQYWDRTGFIKPSRRRYGKYRCYTFLDLAKIRLALRLRAIGLSIQLLRRLMKSVTELILKFNTPLREATFMTDGEAVIMYSGACAANARAKLLFVEVSLPELCLEIEKLWPDGDLPAEELTGT